MTKINSLTDFFVWLAKTYKKEPYNSSYEKYDVCFSYTTDSYIYRYIIDSSNKTMIVSCTSLIDICMHRDMIYSYESLKTMLSRFNYLFSEFIMHNEYMLKNNLVTMLV